MCPSCGYNPDWQARGLEEPPADYVGSLFEGAKLFRKVRHNKVTENEERTLYGCPACNHVWMDY